MIIKDLFKKDITRSIQGVVTIGNEDEEQKWQELEEYVCTDEIVKCFRTFFRRYRESIKTPTPKMGVWITGFFGSGKSHLLKILGYVLENEEIAGVRAVDYFKDKISADNEMVLADMRMCAKEKTKVVLFNIDSKAKSDSKNKTQPIMDIMLRAFNESVGYCGSNPWVADMERTLDDEGILEDFIVRFEEFSHRDWIQARSKALLNRDHIIKALASVRGVTEESAKVFVEDQTKNYTNSTEEFAKIVSAYCKKNKTRVIFLMDEVGQFIGDNTQHMLNLQTCVEDLGKFCKGQAWVVITSQQELTAMLESTRDRQQDFSKIQGRFDTRLLLSGSNADEVIKRRILEKKDNARVPLGALYDSYNSKLSNLILFPNKPTWSGYKDADDFISVYPFVTYQFELLQKVFESIREHGMSEGRHLSQNERSLLGAFQTSAKCCAEMNEGVLVPFDSFYQTVEEFIDYDIKTVFTNAQSRIGLDEFSLRVLKVLFMIKFVKEMPATLDRLATLLIGSVNEDKAALKNRILEALKRLEEETLVQRNGEEYAFLTNIEQDINKQINSSGYNEGEVQRTISDIIYDKVLENSKFRLDGRYDFVLNRYVDTESKGSVSIDGLTIKVYTQFSGKKSDTDLSSESIRSEAIIIDLSEGGFTDELIRANKIATFKRNNSATMTADMAEIMSKKQAEYSDRLKRAEDIIRSALRTAPIYYGGALLDIKQKDGKDRMQDALKIMVAQVFYKLGLVSYFYQDQKALIQMLNESSMLDDDLDNDANKGAYDEVLNRVSSDKSLGKRTTVKALIDVFSKKPYGWRELDILGVVGMLWRVGKIQILVHDSPVDKKNGQFKTDLAKKSNTDTMVVRPYEEIPKEVLYKVRQIMNDAYSVSLPMKEDELKEGVIEFFTKKRDFIAGLKQAYSNDYAGNKAAAAIWQDCKAILSTNDAAAIFNEVIKRADDLENRAETLEQLESFYKEGSNQQKTYKAAGAIVDWYAVNSMLEDLSSLEEVVQSINSILGLEMPFSKMNELANLVFKAGEIKDRILEEKLQKTKKELEKDQRTVQKETEEALGTDLTDDQKDRIREKADAIASQYENWLTTLTKSTPNMDAYITSSSSTVSTYRSFIAQVLSEGREPVVRSKSVRIIDCIPVANKKITSADDVDKVVAELKKKLLAELKENDELNLK